MSVMKNEAARRALDALLEGNRRFAEGRAEHPRQDARRRKEVLASGQYPFAAIVACADSRVPPEIVFDQGLGDLFVVRLAGNLADDLGIASLEYAVEHLEVPLIVILGHSRCGAVKASAEASGCGGRLGAIVSAIAPSIERAKETPGDLIDAAARDNATCVAARLRSCGPVLEKLVARGTLDIVAAFYDLESGRVDIAGEHAE